MNLWLKLQSRFHALFQKRRLDVEMDEELRSHIELRAQANIEAGMNPEEARFEALRQFGHTDGIKETCRDQRGVSWLENLIRDIRIGTRQLWKNPGFSLVVIFTLALGMGANTAIFSVVNAVLLRPLPYPDEGRIVALSEQGANGGGDPIAYPNFEDWLAQQKVFEQIGVYKWESAVLTGLKEPAQLQGARLSSGLLEALAVQPELGRLFRPDEDRPGAAPTVLISHAFWQSRFGGSPGVLNQSITLDGEPHEVVGVMPGHFEFPNKLDYWVPIGLMVTEKGWQDRKNHPGLYGIARLRRGVALPQAREELNLIATRLEQQYPASNTGRRVQIEQLHESAVGGVRRALLMLLGAVGLVLLIACANIAGLFLARSVGRRKEMALRSALGASRSRLILQLLTESMLLALIGSIIGMVFAKVGLKMLATLIAGGVPRADKIALNGTVLMVSAVVALATGFLFGLAPAWASVRTNLQDALKIAGRGSTGGHTRTRYSLITAEIAVTLLLLIGFGLFLRSFHRLQTLNPGFVPDHVLTFEVDLPEQKYANAEKVLAFYQPIIEQLRALPGVQAASLGLRLPLENGTRTTSYVVEGETRLEPGQRPSMCIQVAGPDYFRTIGTPLLRGRFFDASDNREHLRIPDGKMDWASALNVIVIDEDFARRHWPDSNPIGRRIRMAFREDSPWMTVIGVVPRIKWRRLNEEGGLVQCYLPFLQVPMHKMKVLIKTTEGADAVIEAAQAIVSSLDPSQPITNVQTLASLHERSTSHQRLSVTLLGIFGFLALSLAIVGLYGVLAYTVSQRRQEIGVRMALGAQRNSILRMIIGQGLKLALIGVALGIISALTFTRIVASMLFQVAPVDPLTFVAVPLFLIAVSVFACWVPALRASKLDPMIALRTE